MSGSRRRQMTERDEMAPAGPVKRRRMSQDKGES